MSATIVPDLAQIRCLTSHPPRIGAAASIGESDDRSSPRALHPRPGVRDRPVRRRRHDRRARIDVTIDLDSGLMVSELPARLIAQGFRISSLQQEQVNLETAFMRLTKGLVS